MRTVVFCMPPKNREPTERNNANRCVVYAPKNREPVERNNANRCVCMSVFYYICYICIQSLCYTWAKKENYVVGIVVVYNPNYTYELMQIHVRGNKILAPDNFF